jgi:hypothetical protein
MDIPGFPKSVVEEFVIYGQNEIFFKKIIAI